MIRWKDGKVDRSDFLLISVSNSLSMNTPDELADALDIAVAALRELVACKELKDMLDLDFRQEYLAQHGAELADLRAEYEKRKPKAWAAARDALRQIGADQ